MYKFTNGIVVFDEKTRDSYIKAGYKLVKEELKEELNEDNSNSETIETKPRRSNKVSKQL